MYLPGWNCLTVKGEISGSTGVMGHSAGEAKVEGGSYRSVHAHAGHHATDKQLGDPGGFQPVKQISIAEAVGEALYDDMLARKWCNSGVNLYSGGTRQ